MDENIHILISKHAKLLGKPNCGTTSDVWSMKSCRESFACMRGSFVLDGDMLSELTGDLAFKGKLVDLSPIIAFTKFEEKRHTGEALATWKRAALAYYQMDQAVGLATEDGASNNKKSNRIIGIEQAVCADHDIARAVLFGSGDAGSISQNPELKAFTLKAGKQSASFSRSVVANKDLAAAQLAADPELKPHQCKTTSTKNVTRWTGLHKMSQRNRLLKGPICIALTGDAQGECDEDPAERDHGMDVDSGSESGSEAASDGEEQEHANRIANKLYPLAHRCLSNTEFRHNDLFESVLDPAKEATMLVQDEKAGWGEGLDIGMAWLAIKEMRDEACAERLEVISGAGNDESWKEIAGTSLPPMFQKFRKVFAKELTTRFRLDTTPSRHVQLALQMNPTVNVSADGPLLINKNAFYECMSGEYRRALKRQAVQQASQATRPAVAIAPAPAPAPAPTDPPTDPPAPATQPPAPATQPPAPATQPPAKRRRSLLGAVAVKQVGEVVVQDEDTSLLDLKVSAEIEKFEMIRCKTLAKVTSQP